MTRAASRDGRTLNLVLGTIGVMALFLLMAPSLVVIIVSFTSGFSLKFPPPGYSVRWYAALADAWQLQFAAKNSLEVAFSTTVLTVLAGVPAAVVISSAGSAAPPSPEARIILALVLPGPSFALAV